MKTAEFLEAEELQLTELFCKFLMELGSILSDLEKEPTHLEFPIDLHKALLEKSL